MSTELKYQVGISLIKGVGPVMARNLIAYLGGVEAVFKEPVKNLVKVPGVGLSLAKIIAEADVLDRAEQEITFMEKNGVNAVFFTDDNYPTRLSFCDDAPLMLYQKGHINFEQTHVLSIVGTRKATESGKIFCETLVKDLAQRYPDLIIVSGLAYGIDICAHRAALANGLQTAGVLAHGLDHLYPYLHRDTAEQMMEQGALMSEFVSGIKPDRPFFVKRNRIVAGLADAVIVVESGIKGGALITARIASTYNRDVLACPGAPGETYSAGCNYLIKKNIAALIENVEDVEYALGWESRVNKADGVQRSLFTEFNTPEEQSLYNALLNKKELSVNELSIMCQMPVSKVSAFMLSMEFSGMVKVLPGNTYRLMG
ncbi:DNA-protecting protein DprA [Marinilabiliaceae bacterium JC017]|nr:DNA-protecting protein DprA [Marinilabiliaceae bacterium JC017]